jgi:uncharacterized membrane protein YoaK (UPF0700 family)
MSHLLNHFSLKAAKWDGTIVLALLLLWTGVLGCVISSIISQPFDRKQRTFWILMVVFVPLLGVLAYLPFAFSKDAIPYIFLRKKKRHKRDKPEAASAD